MQTLPDDKVDEDPSNKKVTKDLPPQATNVINTRADFQNSIAGKKVQIKKHLSEWRSAENN